MAGEITVGGNILASHTGIDGAGSLTLGNTVAPASSYMFRNKLINGNFDIWQRGTSQTNNGYGSVDRWSSEHTGASKTASQQSFDVGQTEVPGNPKYYYRQVVTSASGDGNGATVNQKIEGVNTLAGKTVTLSFWAKADSNKNIVTELVQSFANSESYSWSPGIGITTHSLTTSWQKFTTTFSIPSISGKIIGPSKSDYLALYFWFDSGSDWSSRTNSLGHQSGTFDIAQVQLEEGEVATPFEHRPYGLELSLCQRYFYKHLTWEWGYQVCRLDHTYARTRVDFKTTMRVIPTISGVSFDSSDGAVTVQGTSVQSTTLVANPNLSGSGDFQAGWTADAEL